MSYPEEFPEALKFHIASSYIDQAIENILKTGYSEDSPGFDAYVKQELFRILNQPTNHGEE